VKASDWWFVELLLGCFCCRKPRERVKV